MRGVAPVNTVLQYDLATLLERAGAQPPRYGRGKWGCPKHHGSRSLSVDMARGLFNCHHAGCDFHGSTETLARELGLARRLCPAQFHEQRQAGERADRAERALYEEVKARRFELLDKLHSLNRLELRAHGGGPNETATWDALAGVYAERLGVLAELTILENSGAADMIRFLSADSATRQAKIHRLVEEGGHCDGQGRFVAVETHCPAAWVRGNL